MTITVPIHAIKLAPGSMVSIHNLTQAQKVKKQDSSSFWAACHPVSVRSVAKIRYQNPLPPSSLIPHPSSLIPHPSSLILHPSSLIPHPSSLIPHPS